MYPPAMNPIGLTLDVSPCISVMLTGYSSSATALLPILSPTSPSPGVHDSEYENPAVMLAGTALKAGTPVRSTSAHAAATRPKDSSNRRSMANFRPSAKVIFFQTRRRGCATLPISIHGRPQSAVRCSEEFWLARRKSVKRSSREFPKLHSMAGWTGVEFGAGQGAVV